VEYFHHPLFVAPEAEEELLRDIKVDDIPTKEQEVHLFRQMNYMKFRALHAATKADSVMWSKRALEVRARLVTLNLRLAKRGAKQVAKKLGLCSDDLIGEANFSLLMAVDKFNYNKGFKFSTYALWVIHRRFKRSKETVHDRCTDPEMLGRIPDPREADAEQTERDELIRDRVNRVLQHVDERKRKVLRRLYGVDGPQLDLEGVGKLMDITGERVRQLRNRGLEILQNKIDKGELVLDS
jgi:RNA polymerase primary sigma factor